MRQNSLTWYQKDIFGKVGAHSLRGRTASESTEELGKDQVREGLQEPYQGVVLYSESPGCILRLFKGE